MRWCPRNGEGLVQMRVRLNEGWQNQVTADIVSMLLWRDFLDHAVAPGDSCSRKFAALAWPVRR